MSEQIPQPPREGEKIGDGIVLGLISAGGSARVYKTWNEALELHRAVKVMDPDAGQEIRDRFVTEARITSKLIHPHIVQINSCGETASGLPYIEMEFISGFTLESVLRQSGALPLPVALAIVVGVLNALHYAHNAKYTLYGLPRQGVMHRDIKPGNVIFSGGIPKLMDFGIARPVNVSLHTKAGNVPGTVAYMPPEACTGGVCDFRSDIYQIGLLLYECVSGRMAFPQNDLIPLLDAIKVGECKPLNTHPKVSAIVKKCMNPDITKRYQTAEECLADMRSLYHTQSPGTAPEGQISAFLLGTTPATVKKVYRGTGKSVKLTVAAVICLSLILALGIGIFTYAPVIIRSIQNLAAETTDPATTEAETAKPVGETPTPTAPSSKQAPVGAAPRGRPASDDRPTAPATKATQDIQATQMPPQEDALFFINAGKRLLAQNNPQEALTNFQRALRIPSATMPRQEAVKQALYGSAQSNTMLYRQGSTSAAMYTASWRAVQNNFPAGSPEHSEATNKLKEAEL
jgi:serine/threonine protein kinase